MSDSEDSRDGQSKKRFKTAYEAQRDVLEKLMSNPVCIK
jgi:hypothetical protein